MRTLLKLFFYPYLRFLVTFHKYALPLLVLVFVLDLDVLMMIAPGLYPFALYSTINRHQFRDNISWMLATFNKRTLIGYHLLSQTFVTLILAVLSGAMTVAITAANVALSSRVPTAGVGSQRAEAFLRQTDWTSTKELVIFGMVLLFLLITLYSPMALKDQLRAAEERWGQKKLTPKMKVLLGAYLVVCAGVLYAQELKLSLFTLPLLALALVAELFYIVYIFNRAFVLFHPRRYLRLAQGGVALALLLTVGIRHRAVEQLRHATNPDQRVSELIFLGPFAPSLSERELLNLLASATDPAPVLEYYELKGQRVPTVLKDRWLTQITSFESIVEIARTMRGKEVQRLNSGNIWKQASESYAKLEATNPAAAQYRLRQLGRHLKEQGWTPLGQTTLALAQRPMLEQLFYLGHIKRQDRKAYALLLERGDLNQRALDIHLDRAPASVERAPTPPASVP